MRHINFSAEVDYLLRWSIMVGISRCKLAKSIQHRLIEFCVLEVTACSSADFLRLQPNTAAPFYKKIRQVIVYHLALEAQEMFDGKIELDESYFGEEAPKGEKRPWSIRKGSCFWHSQEEGQDLHGWL